VQYQGTENVYHTENTYSSVYEKPHTLVGTMDGIEHRLPTISSELEFLNIIGKRFVAALDRFDVHRAIMTTLQEMYSFSACCILLKGYPHQLFIIPCQPLSASFLEDMIRRITNAAQVLGFPSVEAEQLAQTAYFDAPDEVAQFRTQEAIEGTEILSCLNIPLTIENRIIGILSLFDELVGTFDSDLLKLTTMIADYAAFALENVGLREREHALWRQTEHERQRLELIISSMNEGLLITDEHGAVVSINQSAKHLLAQIVEDLPQNIPLQQLAYTQQVQWLQTLAASVEEALHGNTVVSKELVAGDSNEQVPLTLGMSVAPLDDKLSGATHPTGAVIVLNDITASKQVERLKDEFVSVVSHELRTPLTNIKGYTQHLVRRLERRIRKIQETQQVQDIPALDLPESVDLRSVLIVQSQTDRLERLVSDLLDRSRVQWGQLTLEYEGFYLADVLTESIRSVQASAEQHTLYLDIQVADTHIVADKQRINLVIGNLLDNAVKYSPQGGQVTVRLQEQENMYLISVIDQGIGVNPEHYEHIFERFYRVSNASTRQYSGVGLGLFVAKAIVTKHGGNIWLSENKGIGGTTFYVTLPRTHAFATDI
jgi:two-component system phosphate regulon sensor histidine kinase PhoR